MNFGEKVTYLRKERGMSQQQLADILGVTSRTIKNYESGEKYPRQRALYGRMAELFGVDVNYLLTEDEDFISRAAQQYGSGGEKDAKDVLSKAAALFAGGELSEDDRLAFMMEIQQLYFESKQRAKRFTPKKYTSGE